MPAVITIAFDDLINIYKVGDKFGVPVQAPNFDRLANMGVSFEGAYTPATVCNPARTAALSGLSQFTTGLHNTSDRQWSDVMSPQDTVVGMFQNAGWTTYGTGKVFHNSSSIAAAPLFDQIYDAHFQADRAVAPVLDNNPIAEPLEGGEVMRDDSNVAWAIERLNEYNGSENMLLTLGIIKPHRPFIAPQEFFDLYPRDQLRIPYADGDLDEVSAFYQQYRLSESYQEYLDRNDLTLDFIQGYLAALSYADAKLGEILDAMAANDALEDARLVVWSDHGYQLGEKQGWNKFTLWEEAANIPFIIVGPTLEGGTTNSTPVSLLDLTPTLLELGGITPPPGAAFDGSSVLPFLDTPDLGRAVVTTTHGSLSMRVDEHRLIFYNDGSVEFYDVIADPSQLSNLALDPSNAPLVAGLTMRLQAEVSAQGGRFDPNAGTVLGTGGADSMFVTGTQTASGGNGDDIYLVAEGAQVIERAGGGYDRVIFAAREFTVPDNVEFVKNTTYYNDKGFTLFGNDQDNLIEVQSTPGTIYAEGGNDTVQGSGARDSIEGGAGDDLIMGGGENDWLMGGAGADTIDGGAGHDTAAFEISPLSTTVRINAVGTVDVTSRASTITDSASNIETLAFSGDQTFDVQITGGVAALSAAELANLVELYVAYFNRAPDAVGLHFWADQYASGLSLESIANSFFDQPETRALYDQTQEIGAFVDAVYENVLGRAPDLAGFVFWTDVLDTGGVTQGAFVLALLEGARAATGNAADVRFLEDKTDVGTYYALIKGLGDVSGASDVMALLDSTQQSVNDAQIAVNRLFAETAKDPDGGLIIQLVGIVDDPFAV